ncbi:MAG: DUF4175 domain-containing protein [Saprospiraceae bacterium]|nr:DUF4175 domain-containing protein [Saprospiraceae bacterium]
MGLNQNYGLLIEKLDQFIRKFYLNQLIRGALYCSAVVLLLFLSFNVLEYYLYFGTTGRKILFFGFIAMSVATFGYWVLSPLFHYFNLGKTISHEEAAKIIGNHFSDVKDKLLNILNLKKQSDFAENKDLLFAGIDQKTEAIRLVPFKAAIDLRSNKKYLRYALPPFFLLIFLLFAAPSVIKDSTYRIVNNGQEFSKAAPFSFKLDSESLEVPQFEDFSLPILVEGSVLPNEVFVEIDGFQYKAEKKSNSEFSFLFRNVQKDQNFRIVSGSVFGQAHTLKVFAKPNLTDFSISLIYPPYTGKTRETLDNLGDIMVPEGTLAVWSFNTGNTDNLAMRFDKETPVPAERKNENLFQYRKNLRKDYNYQVLFSNKRLPSPDSVNYVISVVKDQYPSIAAEEFIDSTNNNLLFFAGTASDDYGINNLTFHYTLTREKGGVQPEQMLKINVASGKEVSFDYDLDLKKIGLLPGDNMTYYFQVSDNDAINGSKVAKTGVMSFRKPTFEEFKEKENENEEQIKDNLLQSLKDLEKMQENFRKMKEKLLQEKQLDWQSKKEMEKLIEEQKEIQKRLEESKKKLDENLKNQEEFQKPDEEVLEKQKRMEELMKEAINPEQQELMDKIQELIQELEKEDAMQMMNQFEMNNENTSKDMKRLLELYKQLEMEKEVKEQISELEKLAEKQEELAKKTEAEKDPKEELKKDQEALNKKMDELEKKMDELEKKNKELSPPKDLGDDNKEKMDDIQKDMEDSKKEMDSKSGDSKKASKKQKDASKKMKKMAEDLQASMDGGEMEQNSEDIKTIRQLLENLVTVSYDQESLSKDVSNTPTTTPRYVDLVKQQFKIKGDFSVIEDSLTALSMRVDKIESFVTEKVTEIKYNIGHSIEQMEERQSNRAIDNQRRTMTNLNDLALMLSESMKNMQQQMSGSMPGSQMCDKPGGKGGGKSGKMPMDKITEGQQGLNEDLKKMGDKMKNGKEGTAKDFAEAAARQAALRKALQDLQREKQEQGKGSGGLQDIINQMDKVETELVNKRLNAESLTRQKDILTRLLEAEKADRQRELDEKRKGETGEDKVRPLPPSLQEYLKKRQAEAEMYKTVSPSLKAHYKQLVDEYYKALKRQ